MRPLSALLVCVLSTGLVRGQDAESVIKKAIEAAGGAETLKKFPAARLSATGTLTPNDKTTIAVKAEQVYFIPGRSRITMSLEPMGQKLEVVNVVNVDKARYVVNGSPVPITEAASQELVAAMTTLEAAHLLPLLDAKRFTLRLDKLAKDTDTTTVLVASRNGTEMRLGIDRAGQLVRLSRKAYDANSGKTLDQEQVFSDFKSFEGLVRPTKVVVLLDGKKTLELTTEKFTPLATVDAKEFATE